MSDNTKLFVFSTKEVALIIIFNIIVAVTFFMLGVKIGKEYSFKEIGYTQQDKETIDVLSGQEENVEQIPKNTKDYKIEKKSIDDQLKNHIENELNNNGAPQKALDPYDRSETELRENNSSDNKIERISNKADVDNTFSPQKDLIPGPQTEILKKDDYKGKFTIQLGSFRTMREAKSFAAGFVKRGYEPIITEAHPKNKGTWFRVSVGIFDSVSNLKEYVNKEERFFRSQDYIVSKIGD